MMLMVPVESGPETTAPDVPDALVPAKPFVELDPDPSGTVDRVEPVAGSVPSVVKPRLDPMLERLLRGPVPIGAAPREPTVPLSPPTDPPIPPPLPPTCAKAGIARVMDRTETKAKREGDIIAAPSKIGRRSI
jgi:hypothetical protein